MVAVSGRGGQLADCEPKTEAPSHISTSCEDGEVHTSWFTTILRLGRQRGE